MSGLEITCVAWDTSDNTGPIHIVVGTRDEAVQVLKFDSKDQLHPVWSCQIQGTVPKAVAFMEGTVKDIYAFGFSMGTCKVLRLLENWSHVLLGIY